MAFKGKRATDAGLDKTPVRECKAVKFELDSADDSTGEFVGHAAVFGNLDGGRDIIQQGAFTKTIEEDFDRIKILSQHNSYELPIGKPLELREDEKGLYIRGKISSTQQGRDILTLMRDGVLNELSIGYDAVEFDYDGDQNIRYLKEVRLWEVSVVTWAMNEQATIDEVKSADVLELKQLTEDLKAEVKTGKITRSKLNALKPFIAVVRELVEILGPFLEPPEEPEDPPAPAPAPPVKKTKKQSKNAGIIFEIIPTPNRR